MIGRFNSKKVMAAALCASLTAAMGLGGCGSVIPNTTSRAKLGMMPASQALEQMRDDVESWRYAGPVVSKTSPTAARMIEAYKESLEDLNDDIENQIAKASTPEDALREMVEDVSSYVITEFPRHSQALGIDQYRLNVAMGDLINKENDPRLRGALALIKDNLGNNQAFSNDFKLLAASKSRKDELVNALNGGDISIFMNPTGDPVGIVDPNYTYIIEGETWIAREGTFREKLTVTTQIESWHLGTNESAGIETIHRSYFYHPIDEAFITEAENDRRAALQDK